MGIVKDLNHLGMVGTLDPKGFITSKGFGLGPLTSGIKFPNS